MINCFNSNKLIVTDLASIYLDSMYSLDRKFPIHGWNWFANPALFATPMKSFFKVYKVGLNILQPLKQSNLYNLNYIYITYSAKLIYF